MGVERIEINKFYPGNVAFFGAIYGFFIGLILGAVAFALLYFDFLNFSAFGYDVGSFGILYQAVSSVAVVIAVSFLGFLAAFVVSVAYNTISMFGPRLHIGLSEHRGVKVKDWMNKANKSSAGKGNVRIS